jgi:ABC-type transport system substrate-binding protein
MSSVVLVVATSWTLISCADSSPSPSVPGRTPLPPDATAGPSSPPAVPDPGSDLPTLTIAITGDVAPWLDRFTLDGLLRLDDRQRPVPDLAESPPEVSTDGLTWTVRLRDGPTFADGRPVTADDVVRTYELERRRPCGVDPADCLDAILRSVTAVDARTVRFTLEQPRSGFGATHLRAGILNHAIIDAAWDRFLDDRGTINPTDTAAFLSDYATESAAPTGPVGADGRRVVDADRLVRAATALLARGTYRTSNGTAAVDQLEQLDDLVGRIRAIDDSFTSRRADALATAFPFLDLDRAALGSGPYAWTVSEGNALVLDAVLDTGIGHVRLVQVDSAEDAAAMLLDGSVDLAPGLPAAATEGFADAAGVRSARYPGPGFVALTFDLHPDAEGRFADRRIRQALAMCIDIPAAIGAATDSTTARRIPVDSDIPSTSWAYPGSSITTYPVDRAAARRLIEAAGWMLGSDGVYERAGARLQTIVPVRAESPERAAWLRSAATQARECGFELEPREVTFTDIRQMLGSYPLVNVADPDGERPFDVYLGGHAVGVDPDPCALYRSSRCSNAGRPDGSNVGCYVNPAVDRLIEAGRVETDLTRRAGIYAEIASRVSADLPILPIWSDEIVDGIGPALGTTSPGGFVLDRANWYEPVERLTISR